LSDIVPLMIVDIAVEKDASGAVIVCARSIRESRSRS
jgi:hypothetical protein